MAGAASNLPLRQAGAAAAGGGGSQSTTTQEDTETNYAVSSIRQELEDRLGSIERLSVAATVDLSPPEGGGTQPILPKTDVERLIKEAIGFHQDRGDSIQVSEAHLGGVPVEAPSEAEAESAKKMEFYLKWARLARDGAIVAVVVILVLMLVWVLMCRTRPTPVPPGPPGVPPAPPREHLREPGQLADFARRDPERLARALTLLMEQP